jgi:hypothetical protein
VNPGIGSYLSKPGQVPRRESGPGRCPSVPRGSARPRSGSGAGRLALAPPLKLMKVMLQVGEGTNIIVWSIGRTKACSVVVEHFPNSAQSIQSARLSIQLYELGPPTPSPSSECVSPPPWIGKQHGHRVYRVQGFLSSRTNWVPQPPHPQARVQRPTRLRGRGCIGIPNSDEGTDRQIL